MVNFLSLTTATSGKFLKIEISESFVLDPLVQRQVHPSESTSSAASHCSQNFWCHSICRLLDSRLVLTSLLIRDGISTVAAGDRITCYIESWRILYPNASANLFGTEVPPDFPERILTNLQKTYDRDINSCFHSVATKPYVLIKLPSMASISFVSVRNQPTGSLDDKFKNFEVKVGNYSANGDFSNYEHFGTFTGPIASYDIDIVFESETPIYGSFVSIQEIEGIDMNICKIYIYSFE